MAPSLYAIPIILISCGTRLAACLRGNVLNVQPRLITEVSKLEPASGNLSSSFPYEQKEKERSAKRREGRAL